MPIPYTQLHAARLVTQVSTLLLNMQRDMVTNAHAHKAMAQAQSPDIATLQSFVRDVAATYLRLLQYVHDFQAEPTKQARLVAALPRKDADADVADLAMALQGVAETLRDAPRGSYNEIAAACDAVLAEVEKPESVWPE